MNEFFKAYYENIINAIENNELKLDHIDFDCQFCPICEKCQKVSEEGDTRTCGQFIADCIAEK